MFPSSILTRAFLATGIVGSLWFLPALYAQTLPDDVHITPQTGRQSKVDSDKDPSLQTGGGRIKVNVDLVLLPVSITDLMNRPVTGLEKDNFKVFEGKELQDIRHFSGEDIPVSLGVIFDTSGSMSTKIDRAREAVVQFFKTANPEDEFFMIAFSDRPEQLSDFTNSVEDIQGRLLYTMPKGRTALLDAIYFGIGKMREAKYQRKALLIISDGGDNRSRYTEGENLVKEADVMIYAIGTYDNYFSTEEERLGPQLLAAPASAAAYSRWLCLSRSSASLCFPSGVRPAIGVGPSSRQKRDCFRRTAGPPPRCTPSSWVCCAPWIRGKTMRSAPL
ncbi:MAG: VWA domain-containing protein [Acidobacteria bacterium]|nr:MAG: VWA domain-containing protein [Acidobacteriota bacterium]